MKIEGIKTNIRSERKRTYQFPKGDTVTIDYPKELIVRPSGTHRIIDRENHLHVISAGWLHIDIISTKGWVV